MKHLKKLAVEVTVLSIGILAGVQAALPLWEDGEADIAFASSASWLAATPSLTPLPGMDSMQMMPPIPGMEDLQDPMAPVWGAPLRMDEAMMGASFNSAAPAAMIADDGSDKDATIVDLQRQLAEANTQIERLQMEVTRLRGESQPVPIAPVPAMIESMAPDAPALDEMMAQPVAEEPGFFCRYMGLGC